MTNRLDILGVQAFVSIAELSSFRSAANHLHLSESALGRRLKKLEDGLGVRLVNRTTRTVALTQEGTDFLPKARRVVQDLAASLDGLRTGDARPSGTVKVGCLPTLAALFMPALLRTYARDHPQVRIQLFDRSATEIREAVLNGEVDFAITVPGATHHRLDVDKLFTERMVVVCPAGHPMARRASVTWRQLSGESLVSIGTLSANRALIDGLVHDQAINLAWTYQVEHLSTAVALVAGGSGVAILPSAAVFEREASMIAVVPLRAPVLHRDVVLLHRKFPMSVASQRFAELVKRNLHGWRTPVPALGR